MGLDITFSDHHHSVETLQEFGSVINAIHLVADEPSTRFWTFVLYVSENHPGILNVDLKPELLAKTTETLRSAVLPQVTVRESAIHRHKARKSNDDA